MGLPRFVAKTHRLHAWSPAGARPAVCNGEPAVLRAAGLEESSAIRSVIDIRWLSVKRLAASEIASRTAPGGERGTERITELRAEAPNVMRLNELK
jgi:hypothetical protein